MLKITFSIDSDESELDYDALYRSVSALGGYDIEVETLAMPTEPPRRGRRKPTRGHTIANEDGPR